jgi:hypothetical protein
LIDRFKSKLYSIIRNDRCGYIYYDYRTGDYGHGNNHAYNILLPKTPVRSPEADFFSEQLRKDIDHYNILNDNVFKPLLRYNKSILEQIFGEYIYSRWYSIKISYGISNIQSVSVYDNAQRHLEWEIPTFVNDIAMIQESVTNLNESVDRTKKKAEDKVKKTFADFNLVRIDGRPLVMSILEDYWFNKILYGYKNGEKYYNDIVGELPSIENNLVEKEGILMIGANGVVYLPLDKSKFLSVFMALVRDYEIWDSILDLVRKKEEIGDKIYSITRKVEKLVNEIHNDRYYTKLECCPSRMLEPKNKPY